MSARVAAETARLYEGFRGVPVALAVLVLIPVVIGEELVWRGVVQCSLARHLAAPAAVLAAAALYALAQAPLGSPLLVLVAFTCGTAWGAGCVSVTARRRSRRGAPGFRSSSPVPGGN